ncbi:MAG: hypothetical protein FWE04_05390 [Oscillospiraceae bacterium]|nr:hypothetical protein [Oscillospiraceae bacterium]
MIKKIIGLSLAVVMSAIAIAGVFTAVSARVSTGWQDIAEMTNDSDRIQMFAWLEDGTAAPTGHPIVATTVVNGTEFEFDAFVLNYNNYFRLRDLAYILNGTSAQFDIGFDAATNSVAITSGQSYTPVGGELANTHRGLLEYFCSVTSGVRVSTNRFTVDGQETNFVVYNFSCNNYIKLRDLAVIFDFFVDWDGRIIIDTSRGYVPESGEDIAIREGLLRAQAERNVELEREFQESMARFRILEDFFMNVTLEDSMLIPESVKTFTTEYEFDIGGGRPVWFGIWDGMEEWLEFDENGYLPRENSPWGIWGEWESGEGIITRFRRNGDGTFTGMVYNVQVPAELVFN